MKALDLFAGTGWGVACQRLGIEEYGVELVQDVVDVRTANGMTTLYRDVWDGLENPGKYSLDYELLIGSPPCQTFSTTGSGTGRKALGDVLNAIRQGDYRDVARLRELGIRVGDERTALVLTPLAHVWRDRPTFVAFEQVPPVLPVWEACAEVMREMGYSVWVGLVHADKHGVASTRKRAILIASLASEVSPPVAANGSAPRIVDVLPERAGWFLKLSKRPNGAVRSSLELAPTLVFGQDSYSAQWFKTRADAEAHLGFKVDPGYREHLQTREAAMLSSYPSDFLWGTSRAKMFKQISNAVPPLMAEAILRAVTNERSKSEEILRSPRDRVS